MEVTKGAPQREHIGPVIALKPVTQSAQTVPGRIVLESEPGYLEASPSPHSGQAPGRSISIRDESTMEVMNPLVSLKYSVGATH